VGADHPFPMQPADVEPVDDPAARPENANEDRRADVDHVRARRRVPIRSRCSRGAATANTNGPSHTATADASGGHGRPSPARWIRHHAAAVIAGPVTVTARWTMGVIHPKFVLVDHWYVAVDA
jgi:hypothetical protein